MARSSGIVSSAIRAVSTIRSPIEIRDVEQVDRLDGLAHLVDGVIHIIDEAVNVATVEGRNEAAAQREQNLARNVVGVVFDLDHRLAQGRNLVAAIEHGAQGLGAFKRNFGVTFKEVEEFFLFRHQGLKPPKHARLR
jgi:hypothetical protein